MEQQNLPIIAKRVWSIMRVVYLMLRKSISRRKLLDAFLKRGKVAGKALLSAFGHSHRGSHQAPHHLAYEFSCSNSPAFPSKRRHHNLNPFACKHAPPTHDDMHDLTAVSAVKAVLEMLNNTDSLASPALPGFGRSPFVHVRQLRVTDSPFPLTTEADEESNKVVDKAAEDFIRKFYTDLKHQRQTTPPLSSLPSY